MENSVNLASEAKPPFTAAQSSGDGPAPFNVFTTSSPSGFNSSNDVNWDRSSHSDDRSAFTSSGNSSDLAQHAQDATSLGSFTVGDPININHSSDHQPLTSSSLELLSLDATISSPSSTSYYVLPNGGCNKVNELSDNNLVLCSTFEQSSSISGVSSPEAVSYSQSSGSHGIVTGNGSHLATNSLVEKPVSSDTGVFSPDPAFNRVETFGLSPNGLQVSSSRTSSTLSSGHRSLTHKSIDLRKLATFHSFPKLPIEVRLKIWKHACFQRRNVDISLRFTPLAFGDLHLIRYTPYQYLSCSLDPGLLLSCREARKEALKHYNPEFGTIRTTDGAGEDITIKTKDRIYINWESDTICPSVAFTTSRDYREGIKTICHNLSHDAPKVQTLALSALLPLGYLHYFDEFPSLKEIVLFWMPEPRPITYTYNSSADTELGTGDQMLQVLQTALSVDESVKARDLLLKAHALIIEELDYYEEGVDLTIVPTYKTRSCVCKGG